MPAQKKTVKRTKEKKPAVWQPATGAIVRPDGSTLFRVWAPRCSSVQVRLLNADGSVSRDLDMIRDDRNYFVAHADTVRAGAKYFYRLNGKDDRPDPCSRFQPDGVHGPSQVVDPAAFRWTDSKWKGIAPEDYIFYELHTGTFSNKGDFHGVMSRLPHLKRLGISCIEIMPVAQFPGTRNWGYDGVGLYAVQNSYGGPEALKELVNACHSHGIAVCLDVVYNHLGPEGNYLHGYGPYFTNRYHTPWGDAVNYDGPDSDAVREYIIGNALYWVTEYHMDALRLDAIHSIYDFGARHILEELKDRVAEQAKKLGRNVAVIAESDLNDSRIIRSKKEGGYGVDAQWSDDFHHALHVTLTGERGGYYQDFDPFAHLPRVLQNHFVYEGQYSHFRKRKHGNFAGDLPAERFVVFAQNHDQVGNRAAGDRLSVHLSPAAARLTASFLLTSPYLPLIFMGEEYGEKAPFPYFIDHGDPDLVQAVREGRKREFDAFGWHEVPDPASVETYHSARLHWDTLDEPEHAQRLSLYRDLIALRRKLRWIRKKGIRPKIEFSLPGRWLALEYKENRAKRAGMIFNFSKQVLSGKLPLRAKSFHVRLDTSWSRYGGSTPDGKTQHRSRFTLAPESAMIGNW